MLQSEVATKKGDKVLNGVLLKKSQSKVETKGVCRERDNAAHFVYWGRHLTLMTFQNPCFNGLKKKGKETETTLEPEHRHSAYTT